LKPEPLDREDRIKVMMCQELKTVGHATILNKMDNGDVSLGRLHSRGTVLVKVGPVVDFIMPDISLEKMLCVNQKAIRILQRWKSVDDFVDEWNKFFGDYGDGSVNRTIALLDAVCHRFDTSRIYMKISTLLCMRLFS